MISTSNSLRRAVHLALLASAAAAVPTIPAVAQETDSAARPIEEVVITGSRIRRVDEETASPVFVMDAGTIMAEGTPREIVDNADVRRAYLGDDFTL